MTRIRFAFTPNIERQLNYLRQTRANRYQQMKRPVRLLLPAAPTPPKHVSWGM